MTFVFVCIWEGIQIKDDTDLVVAHSTPNLNYAEDLAWLGVWWTGKAVRNLWLCCFECTATFGSSLSPTLL